MLALRWCGLVSAGGQGTSPLPLYSARPAHGAPTTYPSIAATGVSIALPMVFVAFILCVVVLLSYESWRF